MNRVFYLIIQVSALLVIGGSISPSLADVIRLDKPVRASIPNALVLNWPFDEKSGVEAHNAASTGGDYTGFLFAGGFEAPQFVPSLDEAFGNAIHLRGGKKNDPKTDANPYVQWVGKSASELDLAAEPFTAGLWISLNQPLEESGGSPVRLLSRGRYGTGNFWDLSLKKVQSGGGWKTVLDFSVGAGEEGTKFVRAWLRNGLEENRWYHVAVTFEPLSETEARVILHLDGSEVGQGNLIYTAPPLTELDRRLTVGERSVPIFQSHFDGKIDDVFIAKGLHQFDKAP